MKAIFKSIIIILAFVSLWSCNDYLDVTPKGSKLLKTTEDYSELFQHTSRIRNAYNTFDYLDNSWLNPMAVLRDTTAGSNMDISFLYRDYDPEKFSRIKLWNETGGIGNGLYTTFYSNIATFNTVIENVEDSEGGAHEMKARLKAEAQIMVAYNHFLLVNFYGKHFNPKTADSDLAVPIRESYGLEANVKQNTVAELYAFIESRINEALPHLSDSPANCFHPSAAAGYALKAKVHLFKFEYSKAKEAALESYKRNHQLLDLISYYNSGSNYNTRNVVNAEVPENLILGVSSTDFGYMKLISPDLYQRFDTINDVRIKAFYDTQSVNAGIDKGKAPFYNVPPTRFFNNSAGLKVSEVLLILAECYAREGDFSKSMSYITELRNSRYLNNSALPQPTVISLEAAMDTILTERRREFPFGPCRLFDLRRINAEGMLPPITLTKVYPATPNDPTYKQQTYTLRPNSYLYIMPIPQNVLLHDTYMQSTTPEKPEQK